MTTDTRSAARDTATTWPVAELSKAEYDRVVAGATAHATKTVQQQATNSKAKIVIIDDEPINIKVVEKHLRDVGYQDFITTTNSAESMALLRERMPDVVLLDIVMPEPDGLEVLRKIRAEQRFRFLPVLILTACTDDQVKREALELGATDFLTKPVDPNDLAPRVRNALLAKAHQDHLENYAQQLTRQICQKTEELLRVRKKNHKRYLAGKAEIATEVLHNVGNALHSVNIAANFLYQTLRDSRLPSLGKVAKLLEEHDDDLPEFLTEDDRGKLVPAYLVELADNLRAERHTALHEIRTLTKHLEHIKAIVATQHRYASVKSTNEPVTLSVVLNDAEQLSGISSDRYGISIDHDYCRLADIKSDEQKLLQVFINLMKNAIQSIRSGPNAGRGQFLIRTKLKGTNFVRVDFTDNGCGISAENLQHLFSQGFTTKKNGHGFGLHSCANLVKELGGSIYASSDGEGRGATFTVELPINNT